MNLSEENNHLVEANDFVSDQEIKWCPGCGDYVILKQVQKVLADNQVNRDHCVFISGIGCSSRFTYHIETYGMHSIHGRAPAIAMGVKITSPDLSVWVVTGDGDALSIGGNHIIHTLRRNPDINILMFNNRIYGLTKGQYSPTSAINTKTKSSPDGSLDHPFNPVSLALGSGGSFVARTMDCNPAHLREIIDEGYKHKGTSFVEIWQNCTTFNDKIFEDFTNKSVRDDKCLFLEEGKPLLFSSAKRGIALKGCSPELIEINDKTDLTELWIHDPFDKTKASILSELDNVQDFPKIFGVYYKEERPTYEESFQIKSKSMHDRFGSGVLNSILAGRTTWEVN